MGSLLIRVPRCAQRLGLRLLMTQPFISERLRACHKSEKAKEDLEAVRECLLELERRKGFPALLGGYINKDRILTRTKRFDSRSALWGIPNESLGQILNLRH